MTRPLVGSYTRPASVMSPPVPPLSPVEHEGVIIAPRVTQLHVVRVDTSANGRGHAEIEGRARDTLDLARRDERGIDRREVIRVQRDHMTQNVCVAVARQVEITVLCEIDRRRS